MNFKLIFTNNNNTIELEYKVAESNIAKKWFSTIKHLKNIPHDTAETYSFKKLSLADAYEVVRKKYNLENLLTDNIDQTLLNKLHEVFEKICNEKNEHSVEIRKFHHAIHQYEERFSYTSQYFFNVGWGDKEGPLTTKKLLNPFYEKKLYKGNIYSIWGELGKRPSVYHDDKEPNSIERFCELCIPHVTLRPRFTLLLRDKEPKEFNKDFVVWFEDYKTKWFKKYNIKSWTPIDEQSGVLLAELLSDAHLVDQIQNEQLDFQKIVIT